MAQVNRLDPLLGFWESLSESDKKQLSLIYETSTRLGIKLGLTLRSLANLDQAQKSQAPQQLGFPLPRVVLFFGLG